MIARMGFALAVSIVLAMPAQGQAQDAGEPRVETRHRPAPPENFGQVPSQNLELELRRLLMQSVLDQLKLHWHSPAHSEDLSTTVRFLLLPDGSLRDAPEVMNQSGTASFDRSLAQQHAENALRAVRNAAPFNLPPAYYETWQTITIRFDQRM